MAFSNRSSYFTTGFLDSLPEFQNPLQQALRYWNITRQYFNESLFLESIWACGSSLRPYSCYNGVYNSGFRMFGTLWNPVLDKQQKLFGHNRFTIDCKYSLRQVELNLGSTVMFIHLNSSCSSNLIESIVVGAPGLKLLRKEMMVLYLGVA